MQKPEPPIFGENGTVLNSGTMTDEWRNEHAETLERSHKIPWVSIAAVCAFILISYMVPSSYWILIATVFIFSVIFQPVISKADKAPIFERMLSLVTLLPLSSLWLTANNYLDQSMREFWFVTSSVLAISLLLVYYFAKHLMTKRPK